ncbi:MAG: hypothetical protein ABI412_01420 [Sphingomicrobium sp.]
MSVFPPIHGPRAAFRDLRAFMRQRSREQVIGASLAILSTIIITILFFVDSQINTAPPPTITYVTSYPSNRTDAEIIADQKRDQAAIDEAKRKRQEQFQKLQNQLGIQ